MAFALFNIANREIANFHTFIDAIPNAIDDTIKRTIVKAFYVGYFVLPPRIIERRNAELIIQHHATPLECTNSSGSPVQVRYIPSSSSNKSGNALVICLNTTYEDCHPRHWIPFLENGVDIVLWNPTDIVPKQYEEDLFAVLKALRTRNPEQVIALKTYCASSDPAISASSRVDFPVHLIIDRGHGDTPSLIRSFTVISNFSPVTSLIKEHFERSAINKIRTLTGRSLFFIPKDHADQLMEFRGRNFTKELADQVPDDRKTVTYTPGDHWSSWGVTAYSTALQFLISVGIATSVNIDETAYPDPQAPSFWKRHCVPFLIKSWV